MAEFLKTRNVGSLEFGLRGGDYEATTYVHACASSRQLTADGSAQGYSGVCGKAMTKEIVLGSKW
ncbi:hypothetical protein CCMA1212_009740 [Trichoderma ghanense]|uniref:Uncharacterized protein n=1 Tax=Trichoderma ghanense TaxID=65468 RepID=A0ABY2GRW7_9HYPO